jgi:hypothetical protein
LRKGLKVSVDPKGCKVKDWVVKNTQTLGKGLKKSIDPRGCKMKGWVGTNTQTLGKYYQLAQT